MFALGFSRTPEPSFLFPCPRLVFSSPHCYRPSLGHLRHPLFVSSRSRLWLALFLLARVLVRGKDSRFDEVRNQFWVFLAFWVYQIFWVFVVSLPVLWINSVADRLAQGFEPVEIVAIALMALGTVLEVWADVSKYFFRADKANAGLACDQGPWYYSRHPNYFG